MSALTTVRESSPSKAWARALERTSRIARNPGRILPDVIQEYAGDHGSSPALLSDTQQLTYGQLVERSNMYARWALSLGLGRGETVCLLMPNRPEYLAIWLGVIRTGAVVSLLNANLTGRSLAHCIDIVEAKHIIVDSALLDSWTTAEPFLDRKPEVWVDNRDFEGYSAEETGALGSVRPGVSIQDTALYIYTSGTTGLPKAARVSHFRLMQWSHWFAGMMDAVPQDRMYNCLPLYHSVGGVVATGAMLVAGGSVVIRDGFSARSFWNDVRKWDCTLFQYIGELCRYLLCAEANEHESGHRIRMACGNGLRPEVWSPFKERFRIPQIFEFYAATEGNVSLFNIEGKPGAIGRIPPFLAHRFATVLVRLDSETQQPARDEKGFCVRCEPGEIGEAIGRISGDGTNLNSQFEGYTSRDQSDRKVLRDVFEPEDVWFRTGDLMRKDEKGYFYFVDRIGDTFRWKGENVSTQEVSEAICGFSGVREASVYGVTVPGGDGRAGMAALVVDDDLDLTALRTHLTSRLPTYAVPLFLRMRGELQHTATFKHVRNDLVRQSFDPGSTSDPLYFNDPEQATFIRLDQDLFKRIQTGQVRL